MKSKTYLFVFLAVIISLVSACRKPKTEPVKFSSTKYENLGAFDSDGKPLNLSKDTISSDILSFIQTSLPDQQDLSNTHPELFTSSANNDIQITERSDVYITFVYQDCGKTNSIGFYTYPTNNPPQDAKDIDTITYAFPNAGFQSTLLAGDKLKLGTFDAGTSIGFVLLNAAWDLKTQKLNNTAVHFCSDDVLNPEVDPQLKKHAVFIYYPPEKKTLVGFEDTNRTAPECDNDFNDVVFYTTVVP